MTNRKVGLKRLLKLADHMETVPKDRFNMHDWVMGLDARINHCGTGGCMAGHAVEIPAFRKEGYHLFKYNETSRYSSPEFKEFEGDEALQEFFALNADEVEEIFHDYEIQTPKEASKSLINFVKQTKELKK